MERIESMKIFMRVAELKSFTRAAESLMLPKANVSLAVSQLEELLQTRLLHRTTRRVVVSADGELFYQRCRALVADWEETETMFCAEGELSGKLRVDLPVNLARRLMPHLAHFLAQHPNLELELSTTDRLVDVIAEGFDCVVRVGGGAGGQNRLHSRLWGHLRMANCVSPGYIDSFGEPVGLEELANHRMVHYQTHIGGSPLGFEYYDGHTCRYTPMAGVITVNTSDAYQAACLAGLGLIQAPLVGVRAHLESGTLISVLSAYPAEPMPIHLLWPAGRQPTRRVRVFQEWLGSVLSAEATWQP